MKQDEFYIEMGKKLEKIDTIEKYVVRIDKYLHENGLGEKVAANTEGIKRLWIYLPLLFVLLLGIAFK